MMEKYTARIQRRKQILYMFEILEPAKICKMKKPNESMSDARSGWSVERENSTRNEDRHCEKHPVETWEQRPMQRPIE